MSERFEIREGDAVRFLRDLPPYTLVTVDPPWGRLAPLVPQPTRLVMAGDVELAHLESLVHAEPDESQVIVGLGGGSAMDTAKFLAWKTGKDLFQVPSIASVDAPFTETVGVRVGRRVRYVGRVFPRFVLVDLELLRSAPAHLNRAGVGDILSCHTALYDWREASARGLGEPWDEELAGLGRSLLEDLEHHAAEIQGVTPDGLRLLLDANRRIGEACSRAGHPRFEEGSEHFLAYVFEHRTGRRLIHGELIGLCVMAMATIQGNDPERPHRIIAATGLRSHPFDLEIAETEFRACVLDLPGYVKEERLFPTIIDLVPIDAAAASRAWDAVRSLPRVSA